MEHDTVQQDAAGHEVVTAEDTAGQDGQHAEVVGAQDPHGADDGHGDGHGAGPMDVSGAMFLWTLGTFAVVAVLLTKFAWRPILDGLDKREETIRKSVEDAKKVASEMAAIEGERTRRIEEADAKAGDIVSRARQAGIEAERVIKEKAQQDAEILLENARREIGAESEKATAALRSENVDAAIRLAEKILGETLDLDRQKLLNDKLISQL